MNPTVHVTRGVSELRRLLQEETFDLRQLDVDGFHAWLARHESRWQSDPAFVQRVRIRGLRKTHPDLLALERQHRQAVAEDELSPPFARLKRLHQDLIDTQKAISGLTAAIGTASPERQPALQEKLRNFQSQEKTLDEERRRLIAASPARQSRLRIEAELQQLRTAIGLDREQATLERLLQEQGRRMGRAGESFEDLALAITRQSILPELSIAGGDVDPQSLPVLTGVTLGAARIEFDQLIVREPRAGQPAEVLVAVEVKRNINDVARGFRLRQENLAWLTGDSDSYDPSLYRTEAYPSGHFEREGFHEQQGRRFVFDQSSFHRFHRDPSTAFRLDGLYFITRPSFVWGLSAAALGRVRHRVATDAHWAPESNRYLRHLLDWCRSLTKPIETPDVLEAYASNPRYGNQVLLVGSPSAA